MLKKIFAVFMMITVSVNSQTKDPAKLEPEDFYEALTNAEMQLWVALDDGDIIASMVSQIIPYPRKQILRIWCDEPTEE